MRTSVLPRLSGNVRLLRQEPAGADGMKEVIVLQNRLEQFMARSKRTARSLPRKDEGIWPVEEAGSVSLFSERC